MKRLYSMSLDERRNYERAIALTSAVGAKITAAMPSTSDCPIRMDREACGMFISADLADAVDWWTE